MRIITSTTDHRPTDLRVEPVGDGTWRVYEPGDALPTPPEPTLDELKALRIEADRDECRRRLIEHYGTAEEQASRAGGVYGEAARAAWVEGVQATIAASNVARDAILSATRAQQVEAVTVAWPVLV